MKKIVVYFSQSGNTERVAETIEKVENCDIKEIVTKEPYVKDYDKLIEVAKEEIEHGEKPAIESIDISDYDLIYLGTPDWWSAVAPPVATFLSENDFTGKTIAPFITHGGGGNDHIVSDIKELAPQAKILTPLTVAGTGGSILEENVKNWVS